MARETLRPTGRRTLVRGERLFSSGDPVVSVFRVVRGRLRLERCLADGRVLAMHTPRAGELVAEGSLFSASYHCDAVAETRTVVEIEERSVFLGRLAADPEAALAFCRWLSQQLLRARRLLEIRNVRPVRERLLRYLEVRDEPASPEENRPVRLLAGELGISPETLYRLLAELEACGEITRRGRTIRSSSGGLR
jgi:CRP/FNR family transcriptional regulator, dissimilatory nitrate respiration regulator